MNLYGGCRPASCLLRTANTKERFFFETALINFLFLCSEVQKEQ